MKKNIEYKIKDNQRKGKHSQNQRKTNIQKFGECFISESIILMRIFTKQRRKGTWM